MVGSGELDAVLGFVVREKRFLRQSETSFSPKQLRSSESIARKIVRGLEKANGGGAKAALKGLPASVVKPRHVELVQKHLPTFQAAVANGKNHKKNKPKSEHRDMYYVPRAHQYR